MNVRVNVGPKSQAGETSLLAQKIQESGGDGGKLGLKKRGFFGKLKGLFKKGKKLYGQGKKLYKLYKGKGFLE